MTEPAATARPSVWADTAHQSGALSSLAVVAEIRKALVQPLPQLLRAEPGVLAAIKWAARQRGIAVHVVDLSAAGAESQLFGTEEKAGLLAQALGKRELAGQDDPSMLANVLPGKPSVVVFKNFDRAPTGLQSALSEIAADRLIVVGDGSKAPMHPDSRIVAISNSGVGGLTLHDGNHWHRPVPNEQASRLQEALAKAMEQARARGLSPKQSGRWLRALAELQLGAAAAPFAVYLGLGGLVDKFISFREDGLSFHDAYWKTVEPLLSKLSASDRMNLAKVHPKVPAPART